jgi:hypothetical protein
MGRVTEKATRKALEKLVLFKNCLVSFKISKGVEKNGFKVSFLNDKDNP